MALVAWLIILITC